MEVSAQIPKSWLSVFNYLPQIEPNLSTNLKDLINNHPESHDARVDACYFQTVLQQVIQQTHTPGILWLLGMQLNANSLGNFGTYLINAEGIPQIIDDLFRYQPLWLISSASLSIQNDNDRLALTVDSTQFSKSGGQAKAILLSMQLLSAIRQNLGPGFDFDTIHLPINDDPLEDIPDSVSKAKLVSVNHSLTIEIGPKWSSATAVNPNPQMRELLQTPLETDLNNLTAAETFADKVYLFLMKDESIEVKLEHAAEEFNLSPSTFKRRLKEEGTSFKEISETAITGSALQRLLETEDKLEYIAAMLGFSERSSFERAFNRWYGVSPAVFRETNNAIIKHKLNLKDELPASAKVCTDILTILSSDDYTLQNIADAIEQDPIFSARVMGLANSAYYSTSRCNNLLDAVSRAIGVDEIRNLTVLYSATTQLNHGLVTGFDSHRLWFTGMVAMQLAKHLQRVGYEPHMGMQEFLQLTQFSLLGDFVIARSKNENINAWVALHDLPLSHRVSQEPAYFGTNTFVVSAMLLINWGLPNSLAKSLRLLAQRGTGKSAEPDIELLFNLLTAADTLYLTGSWPKEGKLPSHKPKDADTLLANFELDDEELAVIRGIAYSF
jgi:HD-like signal output (HDOD) protein